MRLRALKILVADDNPVSLQFFADALAQAGAACALARDGLEAVAEAERARFDLLLLDARMPGLDGRDALARIRSGGGPSRDTRALATTADADAETRADLLRNGFADVVPKPVAVPALRALLARHLPGLASADSNDRADDGAALDDARALAAVGGDTSIVAALRGLLVAELDKLPAELDAMARAGDFAALRDRLHRLDASAGFCGAPALARAGARLRASIGAEETWPATAAEEFLAACADVRERLTRA